MERTVVDLFCGAGGMSLGFAQAGFEVAFGVDSDRHSVGTFARNHGPASVEDVANVDAEYVLDSAGIGGVGVLVGCPPCQGYSRAGAGRLRSAGRPTGMGDPRNSLYSEFLRLVREIRPEWFVMENVPGMLTVGGGAVRRGIPAGAGPGYSVSFMVLDAADFGVPQHRRRAIVIGNRLGVRNPRPGRTHCPPGEAWGSGLRPHVTVADAISDMPPLGPGEGEPCAPYPEGARPTEYQAGMRRGCDRLYWHVARRQGARDLGIFAMLPPGGKIGDLPGRVNPWPNSFLDRYRKLPVDAPSHAVISHLAKDGMTHVHPDPGQNRSITPREAARLQSFPDSYRFDGPPGSQFRQIGNAVPPLLARMVAESVARAAAGAGAA